MSHRGDVLALLCAETEHGLSAKVLAHLINKANGHVGNEAGKAIDATQLRSALASLLRDGMVTGKRAMSGSGCGMIWRATEKARNERLPK